MRYISRLNSSNFSDRTLKCLNTKKPTVVLVYSKSNPLSRKAFDEFKMLSCALHRNIDWKYLQVYQNYINNSFYVNKLLDTYKVDSVPRYLYFETHDCLHVDDFVKYEIYRNMEWYIPFHSDLQWNTK